jgi:uncharacterized protein with beta-barrel porin domain
VELGYKLAQGWRSFLAIQGQRFAAQGFSEKGNAGENMLLTTGKQSGAASRFELGTRYEDVFRLPDGRQLFLRSQIAWARNHVATPEVSSSFTNLVGSQFSVAGTTAGRDALLLGAALDMPLTASISVGARMDGEWTRNSRGVSGMTSFSVRW